MNKIYINANLKHLRKIRFITQASLADTLKVSRDSIASYEKEENPALPPIDKVVAMSNFFNKTLDEFVLADLASRDDAIIKDVKTLSRTQQKIDTNTREIEEMKTYVVQLQKEAIERLKKQVIALGGTPE